MAGKLPVFCASLLAIAAGNVLFHNTQGEEGVGVETRKVVADPLPAANRSPGRIESQKRSRATRVLFITTKGCQRCEQELARLNKPGGVFESMKSVGWKIGEDSQNHLQIVDEAAIPDLVRLLKVREYPTVACITDGEIVRSFKDGCTTPLDAWTFGWLLKGQNERPQAEISEAIRVESTGNYRLRGNHWSIEADPSPTKQTIVSHLRGPNHGHAAAAYGAIETWSYEELRSLHDDLHEREGGTIGVFAAPNQPIEANRNLGAFAGGRKGW